MHLYLQNVDVNGAPLLVDVAEDAVFGDLVSEVCQGGTVPRGWVRLLVEGEEPAMDLPLSESEVYAGMTMQYSIAPPDEKASRHESLVYHGNVRDKQPACAPVQLAQWVLSLQPALLEASTEDYKDQGHGNTKGVVFFRLTRDGKTVAQLNLFGIARSETSNGGAKQLHPDTALPFIAQCKPGDTICLMYTVGGGGRHTLKAKNLKTAIHFTDTPERNDEVLSVAGRGGGGGGIGGWAANTKYSCFTMLKRALFHRGRKVAPIGFKKDPSLAP